MIHTLNKLIIAAISAKQFCFIIRDYKHIKHTFAIFSVTGVAIIACARVTSIRIGAAGQAGTR